MAKTWAEVVGSEGFQALSDADKSAAREQYFDQVVAPQVPEADLGLAREQFFSSRLSPPPKPPPKPPLSRRPTSVTLWGLVL